MINLHGKSNRKIKRNSTMKKLNFKCRGNKTNDEIVNIFFTDDH